MRGAGMRISAVAVGSGAVIGSLQVGRCRFGWTRRLVNNNRRRRLQSEAGEIRSSEKGVEYRHEESRWFRVEKFARWTVRVTHRRGVDIESAGLSQR